MADDRMLLRHVECVNSVLADCSSSLDFFVGVWYVHVAIAETETLASKESLHL